MEKRPTVKEICSIIKACVDAKVAKITFDSVSIEFQAPIINPAPQWGFVGPDPSEHAHSPVEFDTPIGRSESVPKAQTLADTLDDELLHVEDPVEFERRLFEEPSDAKI